MARFRAPILGAVVSGLALSVAPAEADVAVTGQTYVRHDGGTDAGIEGCNDDEPEFGQSRAPQNEPAIAVNPSEPGFIVAGANEYCEEWLGLQTSDDGGNSWTDSLLPGYATDTSAEGIASPVFGRAVNATDPTMDWDLHGRLFYGAITLNFEKPNNGDASISTFERDPSAPLGIDYVRTVIIGRGTPSQFPVGQWHDKPGLKVDDWPSSPHEGNVYMAWDVVSGGMNQVLFSRSTDHGRSFSKPINITSRVSDPLGPDVAVGPTGEIYVVWRQHDGPKDGGPASTDGFLFVKSTNGGRTFSKQRRVRSVNPYSRSDLALGEEANGRDCGDGDELCETGFVFHRTPSLPQATVDAGGNVYVAFDDVAAVADNGDTYGPDGQARAVVTKSTNGGADWSTPVVADPQSAGHQWWPHIEFDRTTGTLALIYYDSREDPSYSPFRPPGNLASAMSVCGVPVGTSTCNVLNTYIATSTNGVTWSSTKVSSVGHQPEYEIFANNQVPFHGDYLAIDAVAGTVFGLWQDNRDVIPGTDPRESTQDGFDVLQCRSAPDLEIDHCNNAGGDDQNIYGAALP